MTIRREEECRGSSDKSGKKLIGDRTNNHMNDNSGFSVSACKKETSDLALDTRPSSPC